MTEPTDRITDAGNPQPPGSGGPCPSCGATDGCDQPCGRGPVALQAAHEAGHHLGYISIGCPLCRSGSIDTSEGVTGDPAPVAQASAVSTASDPNAGSDAEEQPVTSSEVHFAEDPDFEKVAGDPDRGPVVQHGQPVQMPDGDAGTTVPLPSSHPLGTPVRRSPRFTRERYEEAAELFRPSGQLYPRRWWLFGPRVMPVAWHLQAMAKQTATSDHTAGRLRGQLVQAEQKIARLLRVKATTEAYIAEYKRRMLDAEKDPTMTVARYLDEDRARVHAFREKAQ